MNYKHTLVLGGIYLIVALVIECLKSPLSDAFQTVCLLFFVYYNIKLVFGKEVIFLKKMYDKQNILIGYLMIIGWIPYFILLVGLILLLMSFGANEKSLTDLYSYLDVSTIVLVVVSILFQTYLYFEKYCNFSSRRKKLFKVIKEFFQTLFSIG